MGALRVVESFARGYRHTWRGSAITTFASPVLYLLAMGGGLGTLVDRGAGDSQLSGLPYLTFIAPGLLAATAMQVGAGDGSWPIMAALKWRRTWHAALATPLTPADLAAGHLVWVCVRLLLATVVFSVVMVVFGAVSAAGAARAVPPAVLTGLAFAAPITAYTARLDSDYALASLFRFGIFPIFLFSGTFFPVAQLPDWLEPAAVLTPLWHGVQLTRAAALGTAASASGPSVAAWVSIAYLAALVAGGLLLSARALRRRLLP